MTETLTDEQLASLRRAFNGAKAALLDALNNSCPGEHSPQQHRDGNLPWCPHCGRDNLGVRHAEATA